MPDFDLAYGRTTQRVTLPAEGFGGVLGWRIETPSLPARAVIEEALDEPVAGPSLEERMRGARNAVIIVPDRTRYSAQEAYVPLLVERLAAAGVPPERMTVLFATGTHRGHTAAERAAMVGAELPRGVALVDHDGADEHALVPLGTTPRGTPVSIHRLACETDLVLLTGTLSYHYLAGYGGGRKCLVPGVAAHRSCTALHRWTLAREGADLRDPRCAPGNLAGNPFHEELLAACRLAPAPMFLLNTLLAPSKEVLGAVAGDFVAAHEAGAREWDRRYAVSLDRPADLVVASCGGFPKDINLYQAHKSVLHAARALRPTGVLVLLAACEEGAGNPAFFRWFSHPTLDAHARALRAAFEIPGQTAWSLRDLAARFRIFLIGGLDPAQVASTGMIPARTAAEALGQARVHLPPDPHTLVIPDAGWILPLARSA